MPARARSYGVSFSMGLAVPFHRTAFDGHQPHQAFEQRGFAHAIAPQEHRHFAGLGLHAHIAQDVGAAVVLVQVLNF